MRNVEDLGTIYVTANELPVTESPNLYFGDGCYGECDSITDRFRTDDLAGWYHAINDIIDDISACEDASTPIDIEDLLDNICSLSEADFNSRTKRIQGHVDNLNQKLSEIEATDEWKFLLDPDNDPFKQECIISGRLITKVYKTAQERDDLLVGYSENMSNENWSDDYIFPDGDEGFLDSSARINLLVTKYFHDKITNGIKANQRNLIKLGIAKNSFFAIPVRSLPPSVALSPEISDSHIARGVENRLGSIRDSLAETFDCTFGMSCSNDIDNAAKNPNVGQELTTEARETLGGCVSGTPNGWEPDDEENSRNQQIQSQNFDNKFIKEDLISSANKPINNGGLSAAARSWEKHAGRAGGVFEPLKGNTAQKNEAASNFINEVLNNKGTVRTDLSRGGVEYRLPNGKGIRYNSDSSFSGLLDPKR